MRRLLVLVAGSLTMLVVFASAAVAQQYPPQPGAPAKVTPGARGGGEFAFTGSDSMPLVWIGLAALVVGIALVVATTRRARLRTRGAEIA